MKRYIIIYTLFVLLIRGEKCVVTGIAEVEKENEISLPLNFAYAVKYKQTKILYTETKYIKFVGKISKETITRLNELCEQSNHEDEREYSSRSWEKDGNVYHYKDGLYDLSIDITNNTAVSKSSILDF